MSNADQPPPKVKPQPPKNAADQDSATNNSSGNGSGNSSGRASFDSRGNSVWEWKTETGSFSREVNTQRLKKLEAPELEIEQTGRVKKVDGLSLSNDAQPSGSFNPYDRGPSKKQTPDPYQKRNAKAVTPPKPIATAERKPIKDLKAYSEWLAMKKRLAEQNNKNE
jgi:hypothetical protein